MKLAKKIVSIILLILAIAQFFGPDKNNGELASLSPFIAETKPSEAVHGLLKEACFDCHSNKTNYPWYASITPLNFWLSHHIQEGKEELNFSEWSNYSLKKKEHKMEEVWEEIKKHKMPLESYANIHEEARFSEVEKQLIIDWAKEVQTTYKNELAN